MTPQLVDDHSVSWTVSHDLKVRADRGEFSVSKVGGLGREVKLAALLGMFC